MGSSRWGYSNGRYGSTFSFDQDETITSLSIRWYTENGDVMSASYKLVIEVEDSAATPTFEAFSGNDYSITLPNDAGTVYGGNLHINQDGSGVLTVTKSAHVFDGTENFVLNATNEYRLSNSFGWKRYSLGGYGIASHLAYYGTSGYRYAISDQIYVTWTDGGTKNNFLSILAGLYSNGTPLVIVHDLTEPQTYTLTAQQISSLFGENNVWADTGDVTAEYTADTKTYIERLTQPDQDWTADAGISIGKFFMVGNELYIATSGIAAGETIVPGTNCTKMSLAQALNNINA